MTAQAPEELTIDGVSWLLLATPLDSVLTHPMIPPHTALWRGYVGAWRVDGADLFLDGVHGWIADAEQRPVQVGPDVLLPGQKLPLHATWVSGELRIASGDQVVHVHGGFASEWEQEEILHVERGVITGRVPRARTSSTHTEGEPAEPAHLPRVGVPPAGSQQVHPDGRAQRPWYCMYCGWRCDQSFNDYSCHACRMNRPWMGGSMTMCQCSTCQRWVPAFAKYCEWCGGSLSPIDY